jgi:hypothetical protein
MTNPWLDVPLEDYEGHMSSENVAQLGALSDLFAEALEFRQPRSVAVLGVAGGNGLDRIDTAITTRKVGVDINPAYLATVRERFAHLPHLELHSLDLAVQSANIKPADLVHAALVFEHAGTGMCLENAIALVAPGGAMSVVLQLPSETEQGVTATPYPTIQNLKSHFVLVEPQWLRTNLEARKFRLAHEVRRGLPAGKGFWLGIFVQD